MGRDAEQSRQCVKDARRTRERHGAAGGAVAAYRDALKERTRERVPLQWATSIGSEGVALMLLAERRGNVTMAENALSQINAAFETMRDGGHAPYAAYYEQQLSRPRALVARLRGR
jgi:hypothetical protein